MRKKRGEKKHHPHQESQEKEPQSRWGPVQPTELQGFASFMIPVSVQLGLCSGEAGGRSDSLFHHQS